MNTASAFFCLTGNRKEVRKQPQSRRSLAAVFFGGSDEKGRGVRGEGVDIRSWGVGVRG